MSKLARYSPKGVDKSEAVSLSSGRSIPDWLIAITNGGLICESDGFTIG